MALIRLQRRNEYMNILRRHHVEIDGVKRGMIRKQETVAFEVSPGSHTISASIDWCSSGTKKIMVGENDIINLRITGFRQSAWIVPLGILTGLLEILSTPLLHNTWMSNLWLVILVPCFFVLLYYFTFGRHKYLRIIEQAESTELNEYHPNQTIKQTPVHS